MHSHLPRLVATRLVPILLTATLAACAGDRATAPPTSHTDVQSGATVTLVCNFTQTKSDARAFFSSGSDPVFSIIRDMQSAYGTGGATAATPKGFDVLQQIAAARGTTRQGGTAASGNALTKDVLACMSVGPIPGSFDVTNAIASGIYEVRGGATDATSPALAALAAAGQKSAASPEWGIESLSSWGARFNGLPTRFLVYGAPLPVSSFTTEPVALDANNAAATGFDIATIPVMPGLSFANADGTPGQVRVGICIPQATGTNPNRLLHVGATVTSVLDLSLPSFCSAVASATSSGARGVLAFVRQAIAFMLPTSAYAFSIGGVGSLPSGLSPFGAVQVNASSVALRFTKQPSNGSISAPISPPVAVKAATSAGTPVGGVVITLTVIGNNGINAAVTGNVATTNELGVATFPNLTVTKAGGYTIQASGAISGGSTGTVTSVLFNVNGQ